MVPSLPLLSCEASVSVKENPEKKKKKKNGCASLNKCYQKLNFDVVKMPSSQTLLTFSKI